MKEQIESLTFKNRQLTSDPMQPKLEGQISEQKEQIQSLESTMKKIASMVGSSNDGLVATIHDLVLEREENKLVNEEYKAPT